MFALTRQQMDQTLCADLAFNWCVSTHILCLLTIFQHKQKSCTGSNKRVKIKWANRSREACVALTSLSTCLKCTVNWCDADQPKHGYQFEYVNTFYFSIFTYIQKEWQFFFKTFLQHSYNSVIPLCGAINVLCCWLHCLLSSYR